MHGDVRAATARVGHGHAHVCSGQCRRVVDAIAHHGDRHGPPPSTLITCAALSPGNTSAITSPSSGRRPRRRAMASAAPLLSPEIITVLMPLARKRGQGFLRAGLGFVAKGHQGAKCQACGGALSHRRHGGALLPEGLLPGPPWWRHRHAKLLHPSQAADEKTAHSDLALCAAPGHRAHIRLAPQTPRPCWLSQLATTARASGCSLPLCNAGRRFQQRFLSESIPAAGSSAVSISGGRCVSVPVLSNATTSTLCASSSACASLIRMPNAWPPRRSRP
jgi:hypothetical protein